MGELKSIYLYNKIKNRYDICTFYIKGKLAPSGHQPPLYTLSLVFELRTQPYQFLFSEIFF